MLRPIACRMVRERRRNSTVNGSAYAGGTQGAAPQTAKPPATRQTDGPAFTAAFGGVELAVRASIRTSPTRESLAPARWFDVPKNQAMPRKFNANLTSSSAALATWRYSPQSAALRRAGCLRS